MTVNSGDIKDDPEEGLPLVDLIGLGFLKFFHVGMLFKSCGRLWKFDCLYRV